MKYVGRCLGLLALAAGLAAAAEVDGVLMTRCVPRKLLKTDKRPSWNTPGNAR